VQTVTFAAEIPFGAQALRVWDARPPEHGSPPRPFAGRIGAPSRARRARPPLPHLRASTIVRTEPVLSIVRFVAVARPDLEAERLICERARAGDRPAMGELLRKYGPILYRAVLLPRLGSEAAAQDALAETYARVVERFDRFQWQSCGFYPWLRVVGLRIALDILRARRRETLFEPDDLQREIDASETDLTSRGEMELCEKRDLADARARVEEAMKALNPRYALAIKLRVLEERSREEVAATLGVTVATFDVVLHRSLNALKKALTKSMGESSDQKEAVR
jgi:RNA polymerase sigma factor (sigma-70 family)